MSHCNELHLCILTLFCGVNTIMPGAPSGKHGATALGTTSCVTSQGRKDHLSITTYILIIVAMSRDTELSDNRAT